MPGKFLESVSNVCENSLESSRKVSGSCLEGREQRKPSCQTKELAETKIDRSERKQFLAINSKFQITSIIQKQLDSKYKQVTDNK